MKIPKQFNLFGETIKVILKNNLAGFESKFGEALLNNNIINIDSSLSGEQRDSAFCHELVHFILSKMDHELYKDEQFVGVFSSLLHQAIESFK